MLNIYVVFVFIFTSFFNCVSTEIASKYTQVDLIIQRLEDQRWEQDEAQCIQDTLYLMNNVKNHTLWAVWIWNSMQHPAGLFYGSKYSLGNYDQCLKAPSVTSEPMIITQYCLVDIRLTDVEPKKGGTLDALGTTDEYFKIKSEAGRNTNLITWGTCLPAKCSAPAVTKITKIMYMVNPLASTEPNITVGSCQVAGEKTVYSSAFYVFMTVMALLVIAAVSSTIYVQHNTEDTRLRRVANSFNLERNWTSFTRITGDEIAFIGFTKAFQIILVTCVHCFVFLFIAAVGNGVDFDYYAVKRETMLANLLQHMDLAALDNFFIVSGLLVMKNLLEKKSNPIISLLQRYIRLIGSFTFLIFFAMIVLKYTGDGPLWNKIVEREQKACEENWIWSFLMLNNYVNNDNICQLVAWYVPCDYQLAIMATIMYWIWQRNKRAGKVATALICFLALILPGVVTYWKRIPALVLYDAEHFTDPRSNVVYIDTYMKSHHRVGPYLFGLAVGYILTTYNPAKYRGIIPREWSYIGFLVAGILGLRVWTSAAAWCLGDYDAWNSAVYAALNRNIWAFTTCLSIIVAEYGDIPKLRSIFAWPGFVIFSRLGYGVYITHSLILQRNFFSQRSPLQFDFFSLVVTGLGVVFTSSIFAVLLWLFIEAPLSNLTNLILAPRRKTVVTNVIKYDNNSCEHIINSEKKNRKQL